MTIYNLFLDDDRAEVDKLWEEEEKILQSVAQNNALITASELATGIKYDNPIKTRYIFIKT